MSYSNIITLPKKEFAEALGNIVDRADTVALGGLLQHKTESLDKHFVSRLVCRALSQVGSIGITTMEELLPQVQSSIYQNAIFSTIFYASISQRNELVFIEEHELPQILSKGLGQSAVNEAKRAISDLFTDATLNERSFDIVLNWLRFGSTNADQTHTKRIFELFTASKLRITKSKILEFQVLVESPAKEEVYQQFLTANPIFLDPLAEKVVPKLQLGAEYITDFVIKKLNFEYLLVEIEKPSDKIFTKKDELSADFSHALGQVLDFQNWSSENISYAQKLLPGIHAPEGLLVIGRSSALTKRQSDKLAQLNRSLKSIKVRTYDDILKSATQSYENYLFGELNIE